MHAIVCRYLAFILLLSGGVQFSAANPFEDKRYPPKGIEWDSTGAEPTYDPTKPRANNCYTYAIQDFNSYFTPQSPDGYEARDGCAALSEGVVTDSKGKARVIECPQPEEAPHAMCDNDEYNVMLFRGVMGLEFGYDFHFYRQDSNGFYSHQEGKSKATSLDADGKLINDPRSANRKNSDFKAPYDELCSCFCIKKGGFTLK